MDTKMKKAKMRTQIGIYRAKITPMDRLLKTTVGRKAMLDDLSETLKQNAGKKGGQHYLFIGPRGIGKTHFMSLLENAVAENEQLKSVYTVIRFPEENNRILSFADLLLGIVEILGDVIADEEWQNLFTSLSNNENDEEIIDSIIPRLKHYHKKTGKTLLVFLENLDTLFKQQIKKEQDVHRFRSFLMDSPCATLIGTSPVYFAGLSNIKSPLYEFFDIQIIEDLSEEQTLEIIRKNLQWDCNDVLENFDSLIPKIKAMHTMTGGNPRLIIILYELIANDNLMEVKIQFQELLDRISPFYQERMKDLAPQERALLETMALMRTEPRTPANISRQLRKSQQQTSSLLKRMIKAGYLTASENPKDKRSRLYRIKEGFFDLWLAMSESRIQKTRLVYLVEFFEMYYRDREDREKKRGELWQKIDKETRDEVKKENHFELLDYLSEIGNSLERCQAKLELAVHNIKEGDIKEAEKFFKEVESLAPKSQTFRWMTEQARHWAELGNKFDGSKWLDEMITYWRSQRSGDLEKAIVIAHKLGENLAGNGLHKVRVELLNDALKHTNEPQERSRLYNEIAQSQQMDGLLSESLKSQHAALAIYRNNNDHQGEAAMLNNISSTFITHGEYKQASKYLGDSLTISKQFGNKKSIAISLHNLGIIHEHQGDFKEALEKYNQSLKISEELEDKRGIAYTLGQIGNIHQEQGDYAKAASKYNRCKKISEELGDKSSVAKSLNQLGSIDYLLRDYEKAMDKYYQSIKIKEQLGDKRGIAITFHLLGLIHYKQEEYEKALGKYGKSLKAAEELGDKRGMANTILNIGIVYHEQGDYEQALEKYNRSLEISEEVGDKICIANTLNQIGLIYETQDNHKSALKNYLIAFSIYESSKSPYKEITLKNIKNIMDEIGEDTFKKFYDEIAKELKDKKI